APRLLGAASAVVHRRLPDRPGRGLQHLRRPRPGLRRHRRAPDSGRGHVRTGGDVGAGCDGGAMASSDLDFNPPDDAVQWCLAQDPALLVLDDTVAIDLDEYNDLLAAFGHDTALRGRDADGR